MSHLVGIASVKLGMSMNRMTLEALQGQGGLILERLPALKDLMMLLGYPVDESHMRHILVSEQIHSFLLTIHSPACFAQSNLNNTGFCWDRHRTCSQCRHEGPTGRLAW